MANYRSGASGNWVVEVRRPDVYRLRCPNEPAAGWIASCGVVVSDAAEDLASMQVPDADRGSVFGRGAGDVQPRLWTDVKRIRARAAMRYRPMNFEGNGLMCGIAGINDLSSRRQHAPEGVVRAMGASHLPPRAGRRRLPRTPSDSYLANSPAVDWLGSQTANNPSRTKTKPAGPFFNGEKLRLQRKSAFGTRSQRVYVFRTHTDTELIPQHLGRSRPGDASASQRAIRDLRAGQPHQRSATGSRPRGSARLFYTCHRQRRPKIAGRCSRPRWAALFASGLVERKKPTSRAIWNHISLMMAMPGPTRRYSGEHSAHHSQGVTSLQAGDKPHRNKPPAEDLLADFLTPDADTKTTASDEKKIVDGFEEALLPGSPAASVADVPVVSYLSGGVDSSLVVAMANKVMGRKIPTFTISVTDQKYNEKSEALFVAKHLGCDPVLVECGHDQILHPLCGTDYSRRVPRY